MMTVYREIFCQSACNHLNSRRLPYHWDLNVYRGCTHGCRYCFAMYSHKYMGSDAARRRTHFSGSCWQNTPTWRSQCRSCMPGGGWILSIESRSMKRFPGCKKHMAWWKIIARPYECTSQNRSHISNFPYFDRKPRRTFLCGAVYFLLTFERNVIL